MKKIIAFDLDGTLAESKSPLPDKMSEQLNRLLEKYHVCVISGGKFEQFQTQLLSNLKADADRLQRLHIMPTCGTQYYVYDAMKDNWRQVYAENLSTEQKRKVILALNAALDALNLRPKQAWGELIEDRGSQITLSALGQNAPVDAKEAWDPTGEKKRKLRDLVMEQVTDLEVRTGGSTSIDVTRLGIDKAYGMNKLMEHLDVTKEEILFFGDRLNEGGNDYPVKAMGIDSLEVSSWHDTHLAIRAIVHVSR